MSIKGIYDIHCHIVPGVDDGATDIGETVKLLRMEYEQGVRTVIATPHFRFRMFETPAEKVGWFRKPFFHAQNGGISTFLAFFSTITPSPSSSFSTCLLQ